jgi:hypothetical protein
MGSAEVSKTFSKCPRVSVIREIWCPAFIKRDVIRQVVKSDLKGSQGIV